MKANGKKSHLPFRDELYGIDISTWDEVKKGLEEARKNLNFDLGKFIIYGTINKPMEMEDSKYYTPTIEEFHVGFEYERMNGDTWEKSELSEIDCRSSLNNRGEENEFEEIGLGLRTVKVKYLDREDIESLGFKHTGDAIDIWFKKEGDFQIGSWTSYKIQLHYGIHDNRLYIDAIDTGFEHKIFEGTIKNKSELKVLLKQLGI